ncbi:MAG: UDP-2,3-diacylglucosamine diphosphatase LpxI [Kiritimatiellae bacterium]|nr:UDP-2,3-diacylglucosamine diphosphatase LpxI [Kiritimatiellia bacterium]MDD5521439.1 UDP-2,3-diacylglucosamine diphosphatase LpxI [Kiritimatiellia bacterium]
MNSSAPDVLGLIAGKGVYPLLLAESAKKQGIKHVFAVAFKGETERAIEKYADEVQWIHLGMLEKMLDALSTSGVKHAVMAGQITPTHLFNLRMDSKMLSLLKNLPVRNAETIFGAVAGELKSIGIELMPASMFMESHMPEAGLLSRREPTEVEKNDIEIGLKVARTTSGLDIGQTVVIKQGTILAVEAFEGTDETIERAGRLGGQDAVVIKVAKQGHDMRFDIPVIGLHTMKLLKQIRAGTLAVEAGRAILLEREKIIEQINRMNMCLIAVKIQSTIEEL